MTASLKTQFVELYKKFESPIHIVLYGVLCIFIIFVSYIPKTYTKFSSNIFLRAFFFAAIVLVNNYVTYIHALLLALFVVLFLSFSPGFLESFEDLRIIAKKEYRWYDEQVLGEDPELMETEKVQTQALGSS